MKPLYDFEGCFSDEIEKIKELEIHGWWKCFVQMMDDRISYLFAREINIGTENI